MRRQFYYAKCVPRPGASPHSCVTFVLKLYKHKGNFYYKSFSCKAINDEFYTHFQNFQTTKFEKKGWPDRKVSWMSQEDVFAFLL